MNSYRPLLLIILAAAVVASIFMIPTMAQRADKASEAERKNRREEPPISGTTGSGTSSSATSGSTSSVYSAPYRVYYPAHVDVTATSHLIDSSTPFDESKPGNVLDGNREKAWQEGASGWGAGQSLTIRFKTGRKRIESFKIVVGYDKIRSDRWGDRWPLNARMKAAKITVDGKTFYKQFDTDNRAAQEVEAVRGLVADLITVEVAEVIRGSSAKNEDLCLSEFELTVSDQP